MRQDAVAGTVDRSGAQRRFRPEVQGLRALAVVLVVVYHVLVGRASGGVDVFFVITGFLLTGQLVRAAEAGTLSVVDRWSRAVTRLVPSAAVVLVAVAVGGALVLPTGRWSQTTREVAAAALFVENWQLAAESADYAARSNMTSVVQHFWSLGVQGQVFVLWPLLLAGVGLASARRELVRDRATLVLGAVAALSLTYSVALTAENQPLAYFDTLARLWEFALGGLLALHVDRIALTRPVRVLLGWLGVVGLVACGAVLPVATAFPGWLALWPTGCAAAVLAAGHTGHRRAVDRVLTHPVLRRLGDISYPLYLWHWPLLIGFCVATGRADPGLLPGATIIALSVVLAELTHRLVEKPLSARRRGARDGLRTGALATVCVLLVAGTWQGVALVHATTGAAVGDPLHPGAAALAGPTPGPPARDDDGNLADVDLLPPPATVYEDWNRIEYWDCTPMAEFPQDVCASRPADPAPDPAPAPARRVVVVGDSHAQQISAALVPLARAENWQLIEIIRGGCPFSTRSETDPADTDCTQWLAAAYDEILRLHPDAVVTVASRNVRVGLTEETPPGFVEQWRRLGAANLPVLAIRDNPRFDGSMPDCVERNGRDLDACGAPRTDLYAPDPPWARIPELPPNVRFVDIADAVCTADRCPAVIGNLLVYLDDNHLTATYATSMAPVIEQQVRAGLGW